MGTLNGFETLNLPGVQAFLDYSKIKFDPVSDNFKFTEALRENVPASAAGLVRWEMAADQTKWSEEAVKVIMNAAKALKMLDPQTWIDGNFDAAIIIGGANQAPLVRAEYVMEAISHGHQITRMIITGSARRILKDAERQNVKNYAPDAVTEFDLAKGVFDRLAPRSGNLAMRMFKIDFDGAHNYNIIKTVIANHIESGALTSKPTIIAVTTQIYWLALWLDLQRAARELGIPPEKIRAAGTPSAQTVIDGRSPLSYLYEINRTVQAAANEASISLEY